MARDTPWVVISNSEDPECFDRFPDIDLSKKSSFECGHCNGKNTVELSYEEENHGTNISGVIEYNVEVHCLDCKYTTNWRSTYEFGPTD